jgi:hypothetical protein
MTERMYSEHEVIKIAEDAAERAIAKFSSQLTVSFDDAAKKLGVSIRTIQRLNPRRVGDRIPYSWVLEQAGIRAKSSGSTTNASS